MRALPALTGVVACAVVVSLSGVPAAAAAKPAATVVITSRPKIVIAPPVSRGRPTASVVVKGRVKGRVAPVRAGEVILERKVGNTWKVVGRARVSPTSTFAVTGSRLPLGSSRLRVVKVAAAGSPAVAGTSFSLVVRSPTSAPTKAPVTPRGPIATAPAPLPTAPGAPPVPPTVAPVSEPPVLPAPPVTAPPVTPPSVDPPVLPACSEPVRPPSGLFIAGFQAGTPNGYAMRPFAGQLQADGGEAPYRWAVTGGLPTGITLEGDELTGLTSEKGVFHPSIVVTDAHGRQASANVCIQFVSPLAVRPTVLPQATVGQPYLAPLTAEGGYLPLVWIPENSAMDAGLTLYYNNLTGVFTKPGVVSYIMQVHDGAYTTAGGSVTIPVGPQPTTHSTIRVPADQATITAAIAAARDGDTIVVSPGTYHENVDFNGKAVTLESAEGPATTIIDGGYRDSAVIFRHHESLLSVLRGFTVQHGYSSGISIAVEGGGIAVLDASPTIDGNVVKDNAAMNSGGGIYMLGSGLIENNVVENNRQGLNAGDYVGGLGGGGIAVESAGGAIVIGNQVLDNTWYGYPDGMLVAG
ncbi:MAG: serine protease, partial [Frankiales bacterium]|nr:serine protease [Frankiales bacterium]